MTTDDGRIAFIESELGLCYAFSVLTSIKHEAQDRNAAERSLSHAEEAYAAALKDSKHLPGVMIRDFMAELIRLRQKLDELHRLWKQSAELPEQSTVKRVREDQRLECDMEGDGKKSLELILEEISELGDRRQIAALAHEFWQARGCLEGTAGEDWYLAEREIAERKAENRKLASKPRAAAAGARFPTGSEHAPASEQRILPKRA